MATILCRRLLLLFIGLQVSLFSFSQANQFPLGEYVKMLSDKSGSSSSGIAETIKALEGKDTVVAKKIINEIEAKGNFKNNYFKARFLAMKSKWTWMTLQSSFRSHEELITPMLKEALNAAYETGNDSLISEMAWTYGEACYFHSRTEAATMYLLFAAELDEKIKKTSSAYRCLLVGAVLYKTRDYRKAMYYTLASVQRDADTSAEAKRYIISRYNTVAVCYQRMNNYDSAFIYFDRAMKLANVQKNTVWQAIISGNKGQIYFSQKNYTIAKHLLLYDYNISKAANELASAANSLQWVARINLAEDKKDSALMKVQEALSLVGQRYDPSAPHYLENIYYATADVYRSIGNKDSVLKYAELYSTIHDSIERSVADSRLEISSIKLDNLQNELAIKNLQKEKTAEEQKRNLIIVLIVLALTIALLYINRLRLKHIYKEHLTKQEKAAAETSAREQLELLTQKIIEKTNLAEELQKQLNSRSQAIEQQQLAGTISNLTILTEADWEKFKKLFEELYPGFFMNLQENVNDITLAELRMAALTRLHLSTNQIASILGISANSVYKTKQRLRNRLNLDPESSIEDVIAKM
jgi:hypothetical protein